jgi:hypothetical protein
MANGDTQQQIDRLSARINELQAEDADDIRYDYAKVMFEHIENQIGRVDAKASIFVAASAILVGVNFTLMKEYDLSELAVAIPGGLSLFVSFLALLASLDATTPLGKWSPGTRLIRNPIWPSRRKVTTAAPTPHSPWFFHDIAAPFPAEDGATVRWKSEYEQSKKKFKDTIAPSLTEQALRDDLFEQVWGKAYWAKIRFSLVRRASKLMIASLVLVAISSASALTIGQTKDHASISKIEAALGDDKGGLKKEVTDLLADVAKIKGDLAGNKTLATGIADIKKQLKTVRDNIGSKSSGLVQKAETLTGAIQKADTGRVAATEDLKGVLRKLSGRIDDLDLPRIVTPVFKLF